MVQTSGQTILQDIQLTIRAGEHIAIAATNDIWWRVRIQDGSIVHPMAKD